MSRALASYLHRERNAVVPEPWCYRVALRGQVAGGLIPHEQDDLYRVTRRLRVVLDHLPVARKANVGVDPILEIPKGAQRVIAK